MPTGSAESMAIKLIGVSGLTNAGEAPLLASMHQPDSVSDHIKRPSTVWRVLCMESVSSLSRSAWVGSTQIELPLGPYSRQSVSEVVRTPVMVTV